MRPSNSNLDGFHLTKTKMVANLRFPAQAFVDTTLPNVLWLSINLWKSLGSEKVTKTAHYAVLTEYVVTRAIDKVNDTVDENIGLLYDVGV